MEEVQAKPQKATRARKAKATAILAQETIAQNESVISMNEVGGCQDVDDCTKEVSKAVTRRKSTKTATSAGGASSKRTSSAKQQVFAAKEDDEDMRAISDDENVVLNLKVFGAYKEGCKGGIGGVEAFTGMNEFSGSIFDAGAGGDCEGESFLDAVFNDNQPVHDMPCDTIHDTMNMNSKGPALKVIDLLKDFEEKNKHNEWPTNTTIACYWCCHKFNNTPFGIPVRYCNERFHVYGCFCSLECCAAYNLDSKDAADDVWERSSLINMLARRLDYKNYVRPAPSRLALKLFGGHMEIEEFREYCNSNKIININFPPMMTLTQQIEEINEADVNNDFRYIPIDTDRINKYKEKVKLKRQKPIINFKNTLDHTMNLKYGTTA